MRRVWPVLLLVPWTGCASLYVADADREVGVLLDRYQDQMVRQRSERVRRPAFVNAPEATGAAVGAAVGLSTSAVLPPPTSQPVRTLSMAAALELGFSTSRTFLDQKESLYLAGLDFTLTRYNFGPILDSTISYLWSGAEDSDATDALAADLGVRQILPLGGDVAVSGELAGTRLDNPDPYSTNLPFTWNSGLQVNLRQPLLRGAGYVVSHEALTQGERNLLYAVRAFELFREDFAIQIAAAYYGLVSQKRRLANDEQNYLDAVFDRKKAEALRQVDRNQDEDVFLARRREIEAENNLLVARTDYKLAVDEFKILLGLPTSTNIEIVDDEPPFEPVQVDAQSAVEVAKHNRLDLMTQRDQLEDAERQIVIARNGLLPDFNLTADYGLDSDPRIGADATPGRWSGATGVALELPIDRKAERNTYRATLIAAQRARRDLEERLDEIERDILNQLRALDQIEKRIALQIDQIEQEKRAVAITRLRYESGDVETRDLLDARQALTDAQNLLIDLRVQHFVARLRLQRDLGIFFVNESGNW